MSFTENATKAAERITTGWTHAAGKTFPSMHRLYNAAGMFGCFMIGAYLRDIMRGFSDKGPIEKADVPASLRFMYGVLHHNPHSDEMRCRWNKVLCQIIPAAFGATGAILGSVYFFKSGPNGGREAEMNNIKKAAQNGEKVSIFDADAAASHDTSWMLRVAAGVFATFSAASGLTMLYGFFLNNAFSTAMNRKIFAGTAELTGLEIFRKPSNTTGATQMGPGQAFKDTLDATVKMFQRHAEAGADKLDPVQVEEIRKGMISSLTGVFANVDQKIAGEKITSFIEKAYQDSVQESVNLGDKDPAKIVSFAAGKLNDVFLDGTKEAKVYDSKINDMVTKDTRKFTGGENFINRFLFGTLGMSKEQMKDATIGDNGWVTKLTRPFYGGKNMRALTESWGKTVDQAMRG